MRLTMLRQSRAVGYLPPLSADLLESRSNDVHSRHALHALAGIDK